MVGKNLGEPVGVRPRWVGHLLSANIIEVEKKNQD
jgi:hypothetical protein